MKYPVVLLLACASVLSTACGGDDDSDDSASGGCEAEDAPTYENFGRQFMTDHCTRCHSSERVGRAERNQAPPGYDFDTLEGVRLYAEDVSEEVAGGGMPPTPPKPNQDEIDTLTAWLACGAP